ncbi:MAG: type II toxin-antitoxin system HigB family toxin [Deltaproteobacteria bacterium]|nr:type II toxin-antitoxin system HigB family toxin [Deltaproteobacteria bacterium]
MRLVGREKLLAFQRRHADTRAWIKAWTKEVETAAWKSPQELKERYPTASIINDQAIVFNVKGNSYRLEVIISFAAQVISIGRWGTHADYDKWVW